MRPRVGLSLLLTPGYRAAAAPLFDDGLVDAVEWAIDHEFAGGRAQHETPRWVERVIDAYAADDALYGHGVWLSLLSAGWQDRQERWMERLQAECARRPYQHVSEHLGFMSAGDVVRTASLPVPLTAATIEVGRARVRRLAEAAGVLVGVECQAGGLSPRDATEQGALLDAIVRDDGGFVVLDVHNVHTQAVNFGLDASALLASYPLDRVRELHVSGGSDFRCRDGARVVLDSHDGPVPPAVFALAREALASCPNLEVVFFERRDGTLDEVDDVEGYRDDFRALVELVDRIDDAGVAA